MSSPSQNAVPSLPDDLPETVSKPGETPFDYIIVGSGPGGAPLACRLALAGHRVLVLEAGGDPGSEIPAHASPAERRDAENRKPIYYCPAMHAAASEPHEHKATGGEATSLSFHVRQYAEGPRDDAAKGLPSRLYPRGAALGGCAAHHSMIAVYGADADWQWIADMTRDFTWAPSHMRALYQRLERARYGDYLSPITKWWNKVLDVVVPGRDMDAERGNGGWLDITTTDPKLAVADSQLWRLIQSATLADAPLSWSTLWRYVKRWLQGRFYRDLDLNDARRMRAGPEGIALVPLGVTRKGVRHGPREFLLKTREKLRRSTDPYRGELRIVTGVLVHRILFADENPPRAIGVEYQCGDHIYEVSKPPGSGPDGKPRKCFARREVILCAGAFNTPQILMLSGIGEVSHLEHHGVHGLTFVNKDGKTRKETRDSKGPRKNSDVYINLPGVGQNLRDRSEVSVISEMAEDFASILGARFDPTTSDDQLARWMGKREGPYCTNGGTLAILRRSAPDVPQPDLLIIGFPAWFTGYYEGWSKHLLGPPGSENFRHWSWVILKAFSRNKGQVRLRSAKPTDAPEINFHRFGDHEVSEPKPHWEIDPQHPDLIAIEEAVRYLRQLNRRMNPLFKGGDADRAELLPSSSLQHGTSELRDWIVQKSWGHHAAGTCRVGRDEWQADPALLQDRKAVCDSRFRVHGVRGLRIVDASVLPRIPGYFLVVPVYMLSEKAADTLLHAPPSYPYELQRREAGAIWRRRLRAAEPPRDTNCACSGDPECECPPEPKEMPPGFADLPTDTVGVAFSGGGIRSSSFCLGILQAMAAKGLIRKIDFLSTVSGGGFIGAFLGRLFNRPEVDSQRDPVGYIEAILRDNQSPHLSWLRTNADYINSAGPADLWQHIATYWRNLLVIYLVLGTLGITVLGALGLIGDWLRQWVPPPTGSGRLAEWLPPSVVSAWWWLPPALFIFTILPLSLGYWLAPKRISNAQFSFYPLLAWNVLLCCLAWGLGIATVFPQIYAAGFVSLLLAALFLEGVRCGLSQAPPPAPGSRPSDPGTVVRNRSNQALSKVLQLFLFLLLWVILDSLALAVAGGHLTRLIMVWGALIVPVLPFLRSWAGMLGQKQEGTGGANESPTTGFFRSKSFRAALLAFPIAGFVFISLDALVHWLFAVHPDHAWLLLTSCFALSLVFGRAFDFLNLSSLHGAYASRLARTFLGASNPARFRPPPQSEARDVQVSHPDDDLPFEEYAPEKNGGPIHLIGLCINETIDAASRRIQRARKGLPMCVSQSGVSVGTRYHAVWSSPPRRPSLRWRILQWLDDPQPPKAGTRPAVQAITPPGAAFTPLAGKTSGSVNVERLSLGAWIATSGANFSTGTGRTTSLPVALLHGLVNFRLGYWWHSGLGRTERPGVYPPTLLYWVLTIPMALFRMQGLLLAEFFGSFGGPSYRFWNLSDGGHFDVTGIYELLRRRVPLIIAVDADSDPNNGFESLGDTLCTAGDDFSATIEFVNPANLPAHPLPPWINLAGIGAPPAIGQPSPKHAYLARVTYEDNPTHISWLVLIKASLTGDESLELLAWKQTHPSFPSEPVSEQFFSERQFENYRRLGQHIGQDVF